VRIVYRDYIGITYGLYRDYIGITYGLYRDYIGILLDLRLYIDFTI